MRLQRAWTSCVCGLRDLAVARVRWGYRRLWLLLRREGYPGALKRIYRLYREDGLAIRPRPGTPTDNAFIESFNASVRRELLNASWFLSLADAWERTEPWSSEYNEERPLSPGVTVPPGSTSELTNQKVGPIRGPA